ncbi:MAG: diaminopimelate epimerase [Polyangiaceae bacterium]|jgi:diaminopimelate epimerase
MVGREFAFHKYEGLGNDFVVLDAAEEGTVAPARALALCDRRLGIGADGVILVLPPRVPAVDARMRVINADGSVAEMCGNGVRCVALHVANQRGRRGGSLVIETDAGPRACTLAEGATDSVAMVTVDMGIVRVVGDCTIDVDGEIVTLTTADAGNPHAVLFGAFSRNDIARLGSRIAVHPAFPRGTNVEFARPDGAEIDLVVWERGVGTTLACGTGACATVAVACSKGLAPEGTRVGVRLPGGHLDVTIESDGAASMKGPARRVFSGTLSSGWG